MTDLQKALKNLTMHFIKSFKSRLFLLLHVFSTFFAAIVAHTWVEDVSVLQPDGSLGLRGFPRGNGKASQPVLGLCCVG